MKANNTSKIEMKRHFQRHGVKGMPQWARLEYWNWAEDPLIDYMHNIKNNGHRTRTMMADLTEDDAQITLALKEVSPTTNMTSVSRIRNCLSIATKNALKY